MLGRRFICTNEPASKHDISEIDGFLNSPSPLADVIYGWSPIRPWWQAINQSYPVADNFSFRFVILWQGFRTKRANQYLNNCFIIFYKSARIRVELLGGHFACLCQGFEFYESKKKKKLVIFFHKENGNTFTLLIIFMVKSLQKEQNSTNLLL